MKHKDIDTQGFTSYDKISRNKQLGCVIDAAKIRVSSLGYFSK